jgi:hypothetical protein
MDSEATAINVNHDGFYSSYFFLDIVDIKPVNMEELTEVITAAEFHPLHCNLFMYSSSKGTIKLGDMRESALCDQHSKGKAKQIMFLRVLFRWYDMLNSVTLQSLRKKKILPTNPSFQRSFHRYPMSNSVRMVDISSLVTILL